ncbi:rho GTPase-activating protein 33 isoform X3 [Gadus morhua]|uniref:rho GTPase-activating protein 33 isoform X3 n=1 Tax=Gadus morhua TaxID=8049 RepID=UPI0011B61CF0|nr:rho GTPase-activating protein 33-like isoform X3 [Gadus morhua]
MATLAQSGDPLERTGYPVAEASAGATANLKMNKRVSVVKGHFPKLADCAHFHYDNVDLGAIVLQYLSEQDHGEAKWGAGPSSKVSLVQVTCQGKSWLVRRSYEEFCTLDAHLHQCIYDRRYSRLAPLQPLGQTEDKTEMVCTLLAEYLRRLSGIIDNKLNCGPVLSWMEIDNRGNRFLLKEEASLNVPAIAAARVVKRYTAQASDEISIEVGDILSVIDMPPKEETSWWRGKHCFQVGFFPSECVELINEKQTGSVSGSKTDQDGTSCPGPDSPTSVCKKHGKMLGFLKTFIKSRPSKQKLKQRGILRERVFGCDLGEHLLNSGLDVPQVLVSCSEFLEQHGVVDGIYRHSGVSSNIQKLRHEFDSEIVPDLTKGIYMQDIHCVASLGKLYFRELPNPLLTYQLYDKFADCMGEMTDDERMVKVHDVIQQLPPPHYRTLEYLIRHLSRLATRSGETNMHIKNLAIVWAPNLLRSKEIETAGLVGSDPFREVRVQSVIVEFLLSHVNVLFSDSFTSVGKFTQAPGQLHLARPKSFVSARLLSLEEAQARTQAPLMLQAAPLHPLHPLQEQYHTVLAVQDNRAKKVIKGRKTAASWKTIFDFGKPMRIGSLFQPNMAHFGCRVDSVTLRSAKSEDSLSSQHSGSGSAQYLRSRRPRPSSDGLSLGASVNMESAWPHPNARLSSSRSYDSLLPRDHGLGNQGETGEDGDDEEEEGIYSMPEIPSQGIASRWMAEDLDDFSPTFPDDRPLGLGSTRTSPPSGRHAAYYHGRRPPRPITEDPDSVLNQSEAIARRSLILAATAPPQQAFVQHQASHSCPVQGDLSGQRPADVHQPHERISFTKKMVHALSPKTSKAPTLDISQPVAISVPAKVLEMIGGRAGESQHLATSDSPQSPQMISMLLRSCDIQLSDTCQQELNSKLGATALGMAKGPNGAPPAVQKPPLPKNPARLMALALAESANRAEGALLPYRPPQTGYRPPPHPGYSHQDPESNQQPGLSPEAKPPPPYSTEPKHVDMGTLSSTTSGSDPVTSDLSRVNSSEDDQSSDPFYSSVHVASRDSPVRTDHRQPPAYGRQLSAPPSTASGANANANAAAAAATPGLRQQSDSVPQLCSGAPQPAGGPPSQPQLHHSSSESSPLSRARLPPPSGRPRVPAKPSDLVAPKREPPFQRGGRDLPLQVAPAGPQREQPHPFARTNLRRSLDSGRVRCLIGPPDFQSPLVRAFSERLGGVPDKLARYHAAQAANQLGAGGLPPSALALAAQHHFAQASIKAERLRDKQNPYHEIGGPEGEEPYPFRPPSYSRHAFGPPRPDLEGSLFPAPRLQPRPQPHSSPEAYHGPAPSHHALPEASHFPPSHGDPGPPPQASFSRLPAGSEMHPIPASCFSALTPAAAAAAAASRTFSSPRKARHAPAAASLHASNPPNPQPAPLHPYFENGRVCYRDQPEDAPATAAAAHRAKRPAPPARRHGPQRPYRPPAEPRQPVYVNYPFSLSPSAPPPPAAAAAASSSVALPVGRGWATSDLDTPRERSPLTSPGDSRSSGSLPSPPGGGGGGGGGRAGDDRAPGGPDRGPCAAAAAAAKRSWSEDEDTEPLSGQNLAELLMAKMAAEEDGNEADSDSPSRPGPSSSSSSRRQTHFRGRQYPGADAVPPPPPYAAALFSCSSFQQAGASRRASSGGGGQYHRQAYDVQPPQDPLLRFQRAPDPPSRLNPRSHSSRSCHNPLYPPRRSPHAYPPPGLFGLPSGDPGGYLAQNMHQAAAAAAGPRPPHQAQGSPPGETAPETASLRGVVGQNGVPGAKWSQTRSYC